MSGFVSDDDGNLPSFRVLSPDSGMSTGSFENEEEQPGVFLGVDPRFRVVGTEEPSGLEVLRELPPGPVVQALFRDVIDPRGEPAPQEAAPSAPVRVEDTPIPVPTEDLPAPPLDIPLDEPLNDATRARLVEIVRRLPFLTLESRIRQGQQALTRVRHVQAVQRGELDRQVDAIANVEDDEGFQTILGNIGIIQQDISRRAGIIDRITETGEVLSEVSRERELAGAGVSPDLRLPARRGMERLED